VTRNPDKTASAEVTFASRFNQPFKLKRVEDPTKLLKLEIVESNGPGARVRAQLAAAELGKRYSFIVYTSDKSEPKVEIGMIVYRPISRPPPPASSP
jgi:hypothetical protein